jgi:hypothetical protein
MAHWRTYIESDVIRFVDLGTREATVRISKVERGKVTGIGGKVAGKPMLHLEGKDKPIAANSTICRTIAGLYGNDTAAWVGKFITIYGDPDVSYGGEKVGGIRVRPTIPKEPKATEPSK